MSITGVGVAVGRVALAGRAEERQLRLLVAGEHVGVEAVARRATVRRELRAVGGVAHGARQHGRPALVRRGASIACPVVVEVANTRSIAAWPRRPLASTPSPRRVTSSGARARRSTPAVLHVRDQQPGGVGADVDDRDRASGALRGAASARRPARRAGSRRRARPSARGRCGWPSRCGAGRAGWRASSGSSAGGGSGSVTSSAAPAISPSLERLAAPLVDDRPAGGVDEDRGRAHARERGGVDQVVGVGGQRAVQGDEVAALEQMSWSSGRVGGVQHGHVEARPRAAPPPARCGRSRRCRASRRAPRRRDSGPAPRSASRRPRTAAAASGRRRAAASSSAKARSAVASVSTSGVMPTGMPRGRGGLEVDVVGADRVVGDRPQARRAGRAARRRRGR